MISNFSEKVYKYVMSLTALAAMLISILSFKADHQDKQARLENQRAQAAYSESSKVIEDMSRDIRMNRELLFRLIIANKNIKTPRNVQYDTDKKQEDIPYFKKNKSKLENKKTKKKSELDDIKPTPIRKQKKWQDYKIQNIQQNLIIKQLK